MAIYQYDTNGYMQAMYPRSCQYKVLLDDVPKDLSCVCLHSIAKLSYIICFLCVLSKRYMVYAATGMYEYIYRQLSGCFESFLKHIPSKQLTQQTKLLASAGTINACMQL